MWKKICLLGAGVSLAVGLTACSTSTVGGGTAVPSSKPNGGSSSKASTPSKKSTPKTHGNPGIYPLGTKVEIPETLSGITSVEVFGYYPNVSSSQPDLDTPSSGKSYGAIDAEMCAGPKGSSTGADETDFTILLSNGSTAGSPEILVGHPTVSPLSAESELGSGSQSLSPGQCDRGWVVFGIPNGITPTYVQFSGTTASFTQPNSVVKWTIPAS